MASTLIRLPITPEIVGSKYVRSTRFEIINAGTSGTITIPANAAVVLDDFGGTIDAVVSQAAGGYPTLVSAKSSTGAVIATSFNSAGNWVFTGTPTSYPVAILYRVRQKLSDFDSTATNIWGNSNMEHITKSDLGLQNVDNVADLDKPVSVAQNENALINSLIFG